MVALMRWNVRNATVLVLLVGLSVMLTGFSGSPQAHDRPAGMPVLRHQRRGLP